MKHTLLHNWNLFRVLRLLLAIAIVVQRYISHDAMLAAAGVLFMLLAIFNRGCCAAGNCEAPGKKAGEKSTDEIKYEEVA